MITIKSKVQGKVSDRGIERERWREREREREREIEKEKERGRMEELKKDKSTER